MFKFKTFKPKTGTTTNSSQSSDQQQQQQSESKTSNSDNNTKPQQQSKIEVNDSYKPISDKNMTAHERFKLELQNCAEDDEGEQQQQDSSTPIDFDNFGKSYLAGLGIKNGEALKEGGKSQQYVPKSIGGFASSEKARHDVSKLKIGDHVIILSPAEQKKILQQQQQQQLPTNTSNNNNKSSDAAAAPAIAPPTIKISELVAEDDDDDNDEDNNNNQDAAKNDIRNSVIGQTGALILKLDPKNVQVEICGSGKVQTIQKIFLRGATDGESKEIEKIRQYRLSLVTKSTTTTNSSSFKPFGAFGRNVGGPLVPSNSASNSSIAPFKLFEDIFVTKKKNSSSGQNDGSSNSYYEEEDDDDDQQFLTVTKVLDNGMKALVNSGETLNVTELDVVPPIRPRSHAIIVKKQQNNIEEDAEDENFPIGSLVVCEQILVTNVEIRNVSNGKVKTIEKNCLCSTSRTK